MEQLTLSTASHFAAYLLVSYTSVDQSWEWSITPSLNILYVLLSRAVQPIMKPTLVFRSQRRRLIPRARQPLCPAFEASAIGQASTFSARSFDRCALRHYK